jgi:hypothetical protein
VAISVAAAAALAVAALALFGRSGGGGLDVAAAVERAITPGPGVLHMTTDTENVVGGHTTTTVHEEIWSAQNPVRMRTRMTLSTGGETNESEGALVSVKPPKTLSWLASQPGVIHESTNPVDNTGQTPDAWLREAYGEGRVRVIGRAELDGKAVWRLSVTRAGSQPSAMLEGHEVPAPTVLVDASTFVPLESVVYSAGTVNGHPALETNTTRYLTYQELPATASNEALLNFASHPGAKVVAEPPPSEH